MTIKKISAVALLAIAVSACGPIRGSSSGIQDVEYENGIIAHRASDVWLFSHDPSGGEDALHSGSVTVVDGCLLVDGAVVVWHRSHLAAAAEIAEAVMAGNQLHISVGGGGISAEGEDAGGLPVLITQKCPTMTVWFASGDLNRT